MDNKKLSLTTLLFSSLILPLFGEQNLTLDQNQSQKTPLERTHVLVNQKKKSHQLLHSDGFRSLFGGSPIVVLQDLAYIYFASSLILGNAVTYDEEPSIKQALSCFAVGYGVTAFSTLCHELGHAAAAQLLEGYRSTIYLGGTPTENAGKPLATFGNKHLVISGLNPCRGFTTIKPLYYDHQFNWRRLGVSLAGGACSIAAALLLKMSVYIWYNRSRFNGTPLRTIKTAYKKSLTLDPITMNGLFSMFVPFPNDNDGAYWQTFLFGPE